MSERCPFELWQPVVCRHDFSQEPAHLRALCTSLPATGGIYRVRGFDPMWSPCIGIWLAEITNPLEWTGHEPSFHWRCFRPLNERPKEAETDIGVFYPLLTAKTLEDA